MKRLLVGLLIVTLLSSLLFGLRGVSFAQKVTITFWHILTGVTGNVAEEIVDKFNKTNPRIKVEVTRVPSVNVADISKLMAAIAAGVGPDIYYIDRFTVAQRAYEGILEPLDSLLKEIGWEHPEKEYISYVWKEVLWDNKVYAIPFDTDLRCLFYRKDHFKEVGLNSEVPPKSIKELDTFAEKLTKRDDKGNLIRVGFIPWQGQGSVYTWSVVYGAKWYDAKTKKLVVNNPTMVKVLEWYRSYVDKYKGLLDFTAGFGSQALDPFIAGKLSMIVDTQGRVALIRQFGPNIDYGVTSIPSPSGITRPGHGTWAGGWSVAIPKGSKHPKEALEFARYFCGPEGTILFARGAGGIPPNIEAYRSLRKDPPEPKNIWKVFFDIFPYGTTRPSLPIWGLMWPEQHAVRDYVIYGKKTPKQALDDLVAKCQPELDKIFEKMKK